eukprot:34966-Amphidinium_carterae.1
MSAFHDDSFLASTRGTCHHTDPALNTVLHQNQQRLVNAQPPHNRSHLQLHAQPYCISLLHIHLNFAHTPRLVMENLYVNHHRAAFTTSSTTCLTTRPRTRHKKVQPRG